MIQRTISMPLLIILLLCQSMVFTQSKYQSLPIQVDNSDFYVNKEYKFRIRFPQNWIISRGESKNTVVKAFDYSTASSINIIATEYNLNDPTDAELRMLVNQADKAIRKDYPTALVLEKGIRLVSGRKALYIKFSYTFKQDIGTFTNTIMSFTTSKNGIVYTITASSLSNNFDKVELILIKSVASFVIE